MDETAYMLHYGLPAAVVPDNTMDLALLKLKGNIPQDLGIPDGQADIFC